MNDSKIKTYFQLHILMFDFALFSLVAKIASKNLPPNSDFVFWKLVVYGGLAFLFLGIYAIFFQQILKKVNLTTAFSNKAVVIIWVFIFDVLFIKDTAITMQNIWGKILGFLIILAGIYLMNSERKGTADNG